MPTMTRKAKNTGATGGWSCSNASRPLQLAVAVVREDERRAFGQLDRVVGAPLVLVRDAEERERRAALGLPDRFHRRDLRRLVLERVQAVQVADEDLQRHQHRREVRAEAQRLAAPRVVGRAQQAPRREARRPGTTR